MTFNNSFYKCFTCNKNLCPLCQSKHNNLHNIINYNDKNYICNIHNEIFSSYCNMYMKNTCMLCENDYENLNIIYYRKILPNINNLINMMKELRQKINTLKNNINTIKNICDTVLKNIDIYYEIMNDILNNYNIKKEIIKFYKI